MVVCENLELGTCVEGEKHEAGEAAIEWPDGKDVDDSLISLLVVVQMVRSNISP